MMASENTTSSTLRMPYPENDAGTHWGQCWEHKGHHNCAVRQVMTLTARVRELEAIAAGVEVIEQKIDRAAAVIAREKDKNQELTSFAERAKMLAEKGQHSNMCDARYCQICGFTDYSGCSTLTAHKRTTGRCTCLRGQILALCEEVKCDS